MASDLMASTRDRTSARQQLQARLVENRGRLIALCSELGRNDNQNPPGDTRGMVATCRKILDGVPGITVVCALAFASAAILGRDGDGPHLRSWHLRHESRDCSQRSRCADTGGVQ